MARYPKKDIVAPSPVEEVAPEVKNEAPVLSQIETRPDKSRLDDANKLQSLVNMLKCMPPQYMTPERIKESVYAIGRFEPTDEMIVQAKEALHNEPPRN